MIRKLGLIYIMLGFVLTAMGQSGTFTATANKTTVSVNETFQVTYTITYSDARNFRAPSFGSFNKLGGPNQSTSMQIVNGQTSRSVSYSYYLQPQGEGTYTIGAASIEVGGKKVNSNSLTIKVVKDAGNGGQPSVEDMIRENVFLVMFVDKKQVYKGEQVTATFKLFTRTDISNTSLAESPAFNGFWTQDLDLPANVNFTPEVYQGRQYNAAVIKKVALFPQRSGQLEIEPMELETYARVQVEAPSWGNFFGRYQDVKYNFKSNSATIDVKPLPANGKPKDFSGFVGELSMNVALDKLETETDEPITLTVKYSGTGNLRMLEVPTIDLPRDVEVFDPKTSERISKKNKVEGTRTFDHLVIPRRPGTFKLPPIELSYFDLAKEEYVTLASPEYNITVTGEASGNSGTGSISGLNKEEVELLGQDIRYIHTDDPKLKTRGDYFLGSLEFIGLAVSPFLIFFIVFGLKKRTDKNASDTVGKKRKRATKVASKKLQAAQKFMSEGDNKAFYSETSRALWGYLRDKLNIDPSGLSRDNVKEILTSKGVSSSTIDKIVKVLDDCEMAVYAPSAITGGMDATYSTAKQAIDELEEALK